MNCKDITICWETIVKEMKMLRLGLLFSEILFIYGVLHEGWERHPFLGRRYGAAKKI